ncbi:zinc finger protein ZXDC isoform X2 [Protopterus annectens]|uniref:zinc finger protein ZXDC isoform X2 n=1 Tax=Protopterus annectens TaxID=7888 RepID=UPI001CF9878C|nr:zinc finger protein ZXDC isoform X2 [Protopterus annectens]
MEIQGLFAVQSQIQHQHGGICHQEELPTAGSERCKTVQAGRYSPLHSHEHTDNCSHLVLGPTEHGDHNFTQEDRKKELYTTTENTRVCDADSLLVSNETRQTSEKNGQEELKIKEKQMNLNLPLILVQDNQQKQDEGGGQPPPASRTPEMDSIVLPGSAENKQFFVVFNFVHETDGDLAKESEVSTTCEDGHPKEGILESHISSKNVVPVSEESRTCLFTSVQNDHFGITGDSPNDLKLEYCTASSKGLDFDDDRRSTSNSKVWHTNVMPAIQSSAPARESEEHCLQQDTGVFAGGDLITLNSYPLLGDSTGLLLESVTGLTSEQSVNSDSPCQGTFSGTLTINNQNLIVRLENGVLTLATQSECNEDLLKEDGIDVKAGVALKGLQDVVFIDYENKILESAIAHESENSKESEQQVSEEPTGGLHDESCLDPNSTLNSSVSQKDSEDSASYTIDEVGTAHPDSEDGQLNNYIIANSRDGVQVKLPDGSNLGKKGVLVVYHCSEVNCAKTFDKKHKLKMHILSHTEGQRPFKCTVDGCSWSFTTSYKLKRHLQSHDKVRPFTCHVENCGKRFTTVYNLKAHVKAHEQANSYMCGVCNECFSTPAKLNTHRRTHYEPERPYKCEFPDCQKTFITVSALFSHNRAHYREQEQFYCSFPGCDKRYDKACRLKIHLRSHTGERPFICDFEGCGWSFTSMSKLLRHKRKHEDDRRFTCRVDGCGKSFTRAEHLKGHSITHLGTKPFECPVEGCCAKFSARSSLYIHSKKHLQDVDSLKTQCPVSDCNKHFTSKHSMKSHMVKQHNFSPALLTQLEVTSSLTPSNELTSSGQGDLSNIDITSLFSGVHSNSSSITTDLSLVNSGILTIDAASVGASLGGSVSVSSNPLAQASDPLILTGSSDISHSLDSSLSLGSSNAILHQGTLNLDDVQTVNAEALGSLASLSMRTSNQDLHGLTSTNTLTVDTATLTPSGSLSSSHVSELLIPTKVDRTLLSASDVIGQQEGSKVVTQFVFSSPTNSYSAQTETELSAVSGTSFLESGGSARTDYRAIQLAKKKKQKGTVNSTGIGSLMQKKNKCSKVGISSSSVNPSGRLCGNSGIVLPSCGLTIRDPGTGAQFVQIQLLQLWTVKCLWAATAVLPGFSFLFRIWWFCNSSYGHGTLQLLCFSDVKTG